MSLQKLLAIFLALIFALCAAIVMGLTTISSNLPQLITMADYQPKLVSEVFARDGEKIGEFSRERRKLVAYEDIPEIVIKAFVAAEDSSFFEHGGINYLAIFRAVMANMRAGKKVQGGSTITQQVAKSLLLSPEKTYLRKIKEALLAYKMESNLSKKEILYLYLNQIYFGQGAYGIVFAAETYFGKKLKDLNLAEIAMLAGLPQAPSRYSPINHPLQAKERQKYVLGRMVDLGIVTAQEGNAAVSLPVKILVKKDYRKIAPFYLETIRGLLVQELGEETVLDRGIKIYTGLDYQKQLYANEAIEIGLRSLDKRQGYRGPRNTLKRPDEIITFLTQVRDELKDKQYPYITIQPDGKVVKKTKLDLSRIVHDISKKETKIEVLPPYLKVGDYTQGIVTKVDDEMGLVYVQFAEAQGLIDFESMKWARKPDPNMRIDQAELNKPSQALKAGDVIDIQIIGKTFDSQIIDKKKREKKKLSSNTLSYPQPQLYAHLNLEQVPIVEGALLSFDQKSEEIIAMVGGLDFVKSEFNRTLQAARQTGSAFKVLVYAAALDHGYTPSSSLVDAPIVYEESGPPDEMGDEPKKWKPTNHSKQFSGEVLFRNALIRSMNVPTVKIIEDIGIEFVSEYARRLGVFSPINMDFTLALGSSGITLYEMTKIFSHFGRLGKRIRPLLIHKVLDSNNKEILPLLSLDKKFHRELSELDQNFEKKRLEYLALQEEKSQLPQAENPEKEKKYSTRLYFEDSDQLIDPAMAYVMTTLLRGVIDERDGTGGAARSLGRPVAGKTGTTSQYYDAWFVGYTPQMATGVWVGFDEERSLGKGEVGGRAALPAWLHYMKEAHKELPVQSFTVPSGIVFANIDNETGKLASSKSKQIVNQAYLEGSEPQSSEIKQIREEETDFLKDDLTD